MVRLPWRKEDANVAERVVVADDPLRALLQLGRYGVVVSNSERWQDHPERDVLLRHAVETIDEIFALVPEGFVSIAQTVSQDPGGPEVDVETDPFLICRHPVTNAEYQQFVDAGGYEELENWPQEMWPHLIGFKDQSGSAGPRFWLSGRHDPQLADHPVVGVSFYEASAYAVWAGYRLASEAEWQMAASWRTRTTAHIFHSFPWGDAFDTDRCNIWATGLGTTVSVDRFPEGAAPNGALQLIGNVWEWTSSTFEAFDEHGRPVVGSTLMKSVRGGAFDTYFSAQTTSDFRTGVGALIRPHNVGIRCAMPLVGA